MNVEQLARLASTAQPPAIEETAARRMIERAMVVARGTEVLVAETKPRSWAWLVPVLAVGAAIAIAWLAPRREAVRERQVLARVVLPTGDRIVGTARYEIAELAPARRRIVLREGTMLCDVAHVVAGQRFEVATDDMSVVAKGTVFSVSSEGRVHVYEGVVEVTELGGTRTLRAGDSWGRGEDSPELIAAASASVVERAAHAAPATATATASASVTASATATETEPAAATEPASREPKAESRKPKADPDPVPAPATPPAPSALDTALAHYTTAYNLFHTQHDPEAALAALAGVDDPDAPFEERGLALRTQILASLGRKDDAKAAALRYLDRFPHGELRSYMKGMSQ